LLFLQMYQTFPMITQLYFEKKQNRFNPFFLATLLCTETNASSLPHGLEMMHMLVSRTLLVEL
jgi:hypothetical protein